jgi:hypothetical protein
MQQAAAADLANPLGPDGPPYDLGWELYGGKYAYFWTNYDNSYETEYSFDGGSTTEGTFGPGVAYWESGSSIFKSQFALRHKSGGLFSSWVPLVA